MPVIVFHESNMVANNDQQAFWSRNDHVHSLKGKKKKTIDWICSEKLRIYQPTHAWIIHKTEHSAGSNSGNNHYRPFLALKHFSRSNGNIVEFISATSSSDFLTLEFVRGHNTNIRLFDLNFSPWVKSQQFPNIVHDGFYLFPIEHTFW